MEMRRHRSRRDHEAIALLDFSHGAGLKWVSRIMIPPAQLAHSVWLEIQNTVYVAPHKPCCSFWHQQMVHVQCLILCALHPAIGGWLLYLLAGAVHVPSPVDALRADAILSTYIASLCPAELAHSLSISVHCLEGCKEKGEERARPNHSEVGWVSPSCEAGVSAAGQRA